MLHEPLRAVGRQSTFLHAVKGVQGLPWQNGVAYSPQVCNPNELQLHYCCLHYLWRRRTWWKRWKNLKRWA